MIAGGVTDAETAFTSVAARRFASPSCRQSKALSSRFSDAGCPASKGIRLSGERVITRVDSFQSTSPSSPLGRTPQAPAIFRFTARMAGGRINALERRIGLSSDGTRAPTPGPEWHGGGRGRPSTQTYRPITYCGRKMVLTTGTTFEYEEATAKFAAAVTEFQRKTGTSPKKYYERLNRTANESRVKIQASA